MYFCCIFCVFFLKIDSFRAVLSGIIRQDLVVKGADSSAFFIATEPKARGSNPLWRAKTPDFSGVFSNILR